MAPARHFQNLARVCHSVAHMPVHVTIQMLNGEVYDMLNGQVHGHADVHSLKMMLSQLVGVRPSRLELVSLTGRRCGRGERILDLTEWPLADILDPKVLRRVQMEVTLNAIVCDTQCFVCGAGAALLCLGCRRRRYCSRACQLNDWQDHKRSCGAV